VPSDPSQYRWRDVTVFCGAFLVCYLLSGFVTGVDVVLQLGAAVVCLFAATLAVRAVRRGWFPWPDDDRTR